VTAAAVVPIWALTVVSFAGPDLALTTARGLWVALYDDSYMALFAMACSISHRAVVNS
jgi:hypothetical protein